MPEKIVSPVRVILFEPGGWAAKKEEISKRVAQIMRRSGFMDHLGNALNCHVITEMAEA